MKSLHDALQHLFGTSPESTPAVPAALRDALAAEAASQSRYDYPLVRFIDELLPDSASSLSNECQPAVEAPSQAEISYDNQGLPCPSVKEDDHMRDYDHAAADIAPEKHPKVSGKFPTACHQESALDDLLSGLKACDPRAFSKRLQQGVREVHGGNPVAFYNAAGISRSAYSRLVSHPDRHPSKDTVLCMAAALRMSLPDAETFLRLAGYALSPHIPSDLVWQHCFQQGIHDLALIRKALVTRLPGPSC